ncbi:MAG: imidazole glycerol phosphate synthase subunit HisF [Candidatus Marinimicrobia bacterium]|nr:imidazole glycerol phosphate synthase subunit HisF [Candidatus Neomarinimicrobiota bacterium]
MLTKRIVPCLDVKDGRTVKGIKFKNLRDAGDPVELASFYSSAGADELVLLDISASIEGRNIFLDIVKDVAKEINIPFTVGGGISSIEQVVTVIEAGAEKVSLNTAAVLNPDLIRQASLEVGSQSIVAAVDAKRNGDSWNIYIKGGTEHTGIDALEWIKKVEDLGAGEILVTSMDKDGTGEGFDLDLLSEINLRVNIPVIASGGAGEMSSFFDAFTIGNADAALAASVFHYEKYSIEELKQYLLRNNVQVRI